MRTKAAWKNSNGGPWTPHPMATVVSRMPRQVLRPRRQKPGTRRVQRTCSPRHEHGACEQAPEKSRGTNAGSSFRRTYEHLQVFPDGKVFPRYSAQRHSRSDRAPYTHPQSRRRPEYQLPFGLCRRIGAQLAPPKRRLPREDRSREYFDVSSEEDRIVLKSLRPSRTDDPNLMEAPNSSVIGYGRYHGPMSATDNPSSTDESPRLAAVRTVLAECFWGDYDLSAEEIVRRLGSDDEAFKRFLFGRIADNASYPSRLMRQLFSDSEIHTLLESTMRQQRWTDLRHRLIRANLTGDRSLVPERSWRR